jgi:putative peptidoglycan lipid II flippase
MERFFKLFNQEFSKISEAAFVLGIFTLLSQILAIVRDRILAGQVGPGSILDSYYAAFRIPDLLFTLGAAIVSVSILMPFFTEKISEGKGKDFINGVFTSFFLFITLSAVILAILMPMITKASLVGFDQATIENTILLSRIMLLSPILLGISNLLATITQTFKKFFVYALAPVFYNLGIILGITWLYPLFGIAGFAYGVVLGAILHILIQVPVVIKEGYFPKFTKKIDWNNIATILKHSLPRTLTLSMSKIVFLIFVSIASSLSAGAISVFNLSYNLQSVPLALIGVSYSVAAFPTLVEFYNGKNFDRFMEHVMIPIRQIIFWSMPIVALFIVLRAQIVRVILGTGNFDWSDTRLTAAALALFIISVVAQSIILLLVRAYYAAGRTWKPLWITLGTSAISVLLAFLFKYIFLHVHGVQVFFESLLRIEGVAGSSITMLALAYSVGTFLNFWLLWVTFKRDFDYQPIFNIATTTWQSISAAVLIGSTSYLGLQFFDTFFSQTKVLHVFAHGFTAGILGLIVGVTYLFVIKNQEIRLLVGAAKSKLQRNRPVLTEGETNM